MFKGPAAPWILLVAYLFGAAFFAIFPAVAIRDSVLVWFQARDAELVEVQGTLLEGEIRREYRNRRSVRVVDVRYAYEFDGTAYTGTRLTFAPTQEDLVPTREIESMLADAWASGSIPVHVDRNNPTLAVLRTEREGIIPLSTTIMSAVSGAIAALLVWTIISHVTRWARGDRWWIHSFEKGP
jgi:hypothetical protein